MPDNFTPPPFKFENDGRGPFAYDVDDVPDDAMHDYALGTADDEPPRFAI